MYLCNDSPIDTRRLVITTNANIVVLHWKKHTHLIVLYRLLDLSKSVRIPGTEALPPDLDGPVNWKGRLFCVVLFSVAASNALELLFVLRLEIGMKLNKFCRHDEKKGEREKSAASAEHMFDVQNPLPFINMIAHVYECVNIAIFYWIKAYQFGHINQRQCTTTTSKLHVRNSASFVIVLKNNLLTTLQLAIKKHALGCKKHEQKVTRQKIHQNEWHSRNVLTMVACKYLAAAHKYYKGERTDWWFKKRVYGAIFCNKCTLEERLWQIAALSATTLIWCDIWEWNVFTYLMQNRPLSIAPARPNSILRTEEPPLTLPALVNHVALLWIFAAAPHLFARQSTL